MKLHLPQISKKNLYEGVAIINPLIGGSLLLKNEHDKNPEGFKSTLKSVHETIKTDIGQGASTLGKGLQSGSKMIGGAFDKLLLPLAIISGLIIAVLVLKK